MQYLIKSNQVVCCGTKELIMQYISNSHKSSLKDEKSVNWNYDYVSFENFIETLGYSIKDKLPSNCKIEGTKITSAQFMKTWKECNYDVAETSIKLKLAERNVTNIIKKMKFKRGIVN